MCERIFLIAEFVQNWSRIYPLTDYRFPDPRFLLSIHISCRPSKACVRVTGSAYSRSPPDGRPRANRVKRIERSSKRCFKNIAVASPSRVGFVANITSSMLSRSNRTISSSIFKFQHFTRIMSINYFIYI